MAELTALESKIGEVIGLAMAAQGATDKVGKLVEEEGNHGDLRQALDRMHKEAMEAEERTTGLAENLEGKKTAILEKARETKQEATEMMSTYLYHVADNEQTMREYGSQAVVLQTALNPVIALELLANGTWNGTGVLGPEAFDAVPFLDLLAAYGSPHGAMER